MIYSAWENMRGFYAKGAPFSIRNLNICGFWYPWGSWNPCPTGSKGQQNYIDRANRVFRVTPVVQGSLTRGLLEKPVDF